MGNPEFDQHRHFCSGLRSRRSRKLIYAGLTWERPNTGAPEANEHLSINTRLFVSVIYTEAVVTV